MLRRDDRLRDLRVNENIIHLLVDEDVLHLLWRDMGCSRGGGEGRRHADDAMRAMKRSSSSSRRRA